MEKKQNKRIARADLLLIGLLFFVGAASFLAVRAWTGKGGASVRITADGALYGTYDLAKDQAIPIQNGGHVTNTLLISGGKASMTDADCPDKLCVHQSAVSRQGETIVCLPNKIVVEIEGEEPSLFDSVSR